MSDRLPYLVSELLFMLNETIEGAEENGHHDLAEIARGIVNEAMTGEQTPKE